MVRVKGGVNTNRRHKKVLKLAKGYWQSRNDLISKATEAVLHAGEYAFAGRKMKKRQFRSLWITRINAALKENGMKYNQFIHTLKNKNCRVDRKIMAQIAVEHPKVFDAIVGEVKK